MQDVRQPPLVQKASVTSLVYCVSIPLLKLWDSKPSLGKDMRQSPPMFSTAPDSTPTEPRSGFQRSDPRDGL